MVQSALSTMKKNLPVELADADAVCQVQVVRAEKAIQFAKDAAVAEAVKNMKKSNDQLTELLQRQTDENGNDWLLKLRTKMSLKELDKIAKQFGVNKVHPVEVDEALATSVELRADLKKACEKFDLDARTKTEYSSSCKLTRSVEVLTSAYGLLQFAVDPPKDKVQALRAVRKLLSSVALDKLDQAKDDDHYVPKYLVDGVKKQYHIS